jgi:predicted O-methyltransferase YrrM
MYKIEPMFSKGSWERLEKHIKPGMLVFEWGVGRSTTWFAQRASRVVAVDHDQFWIGHVDQVLNEAGVREKVELVLIPGIKVDVSDIVLDTYARGIEKRAETFDVVSIDGWNRNSCTSCAAPLVKPGGVIVFDDSQEARYSASMRILSDKRLWHREDFVGQPGEKHAGVTTSLFWRLRD